MDIKLKNRRLLRITVADTTSLDSCTVVVRQAALACFEVFIDGGFLPNGEESWAFQTIEQAESEAYKLAVLLRVTFNEGV